MANPGQHPDRSGRDRGDELLDEAFGRANPNPTRQGCLGRDVLIGLARRERPIGDPAYEHLLDCSPCYLEFRELQAEGAALQTPAASRRWWLAAAAAVILAAAGAWLAFYSGRAAQQSTAEPATHAAELHVQLDLRKYTVMRGDQTTPAPPPLSLPRARLAVTILLPVGSEPGQYDLRIVDSSLRSLASARGAAEMRNFVTTLLATIDLRSLAPGRYQLALRRRGDAWRLFPAELR